MANNLGLDPFPDLVGHFGAPWRPFWILQVVLFWCRFVYQPGAVLWIRLVPCCWSAWGRVTFFDPLSHFWLKLAVRCFRRWGVADGERVPPAPLGWYLKLLLLLDYWGMAQLSCVLDFLAVLDDLLISIKSLKNSPGQLEMYSGRVEWQWNEQVWQTVRKTDTRTHRKVFL